MYTKEIDILLSGGIGVIPTDTLYGIVGRAQQPQTIERIYTIKGRDEDKPLIILISSLEELEIFGIEITNSEEELLRNVWPGKVTVIFPCESEKYAYLHRGKKSLAFRIPASPMLIDILKHTGPLVAPSANVQDKKPAHTVSQAKEYFGDAIDFYIDGGEINSLPSTIVKLEENRFVLMRDGAQKIKKELLTDY